MKRREGLLEDLQSIEVNTILKASMSAEKMPQLPFALLDIIHGYGCKLQVELGIDLEPYLRPSRQRCWRRVANGVPTTDAPQLRNYIAQARETQTSVAQLRGEAPPAQPTDPASAPYDERTFNCLPDLWPAFHLGALHDFEQSIDGAADLPPGCFGQPGKSFSMEHVRNGWDTFERLRRATSDAIKAGRISGEEASVTRIITNCSHLKYIVQGLEQSPPKPTKTTWVERLIARFQRRKNPDGSVDPTAELAELIPKTRDELLNGSIRHKEVPQLLSSAELAVVRKAWEFGTEEVMAQTCVQLDGDVITRISHELLDGEVAEHHATLMATHRDSVELGLSQWRALLDTAIEFVSRLGNLLR